MSVLGKAPPNPFQSIHWGQILSDASLAKYRIESADPEKQWGLGIAKVMEVDYEGFTVTLRVVIGAAGTDDRVPVPLTVPGAGARHFFGAMPQVGDFCVIGWMVQESLKATARTPVILSWVVPGVWPGREWLTTSQFGASEMDHTPKQQAVLQGTFPRTRHKLRHAHPGNVVAFSSQGSDLILDEGVTLSNRRGNEFRLRDQDQAAVTRALQRFDALAGVRAYHGMVQRDAQFLPPTMVSDGFDWASGKQRGEDGLPVSEGGLPPDPTAPAKFLTPARTMGKVLNSSDALVTGLFTFKDHIDPFEFLKRGGFINETGFVVNPKPISDGIYGGKDIYRVAAGKDVNAAASNVPTLTEYRVEVTHTTDGLLPVTEQTDGFDAERLPLSDPKTPGGTPNAPFIEHVLGSVVGNDPYTDKGRKSYGLPLVPKVFTAEGAAAPRLDPVPLTLSEKTDTPPIPMGEHAATLFKLAPIDGTAASWTSFNKKGQFKGFISGPRNQDSVQLAIAGGLALSLSGRLRLILNGGYDFVTKAKSGSLFRSSEGPVVIYGGGSIGGGEAKSAKANGTEDDLPSVDIEARTTARIRAGRKVILKGQVVETRSKKVVMRNVSNFDVDAADGKINFKAETIDMVCSGKRKDEFSGPKNFSPTAGPLHERAYTPAYPGLTAEKYSITWGDREEELKLGDHTTSILIGDATYETLLGKVTMQAVFSKVVLSATGIEAKAPIGVITLKASAGTASMSALAFVQIEATAGVASVKGGLGVLLQGPIYGPDSGPILCAGSLEPFTQIPFGALGTTGAAGHLVTP